MCVCGVSKMAKSPTGHRTGCWLNLLTQMIMLIPCLIQLLNVLFRCIEPPWLFWAARMGPCIHFPISCDQLRAAFGRMSKFENYSSMDMQQLMHLWCLHCIVMLLCSGVLHGARHLILTVLVTTSFFCILTVCSWLDKTWVGTQKCVLTVHHLSRTFTLQHIHNQWILF